VLTRLAKDGKKVKAIVPVDLLGKAVNYTDICTIADEFNVPVLADAAESLGAHHRGKPAGSFGRASTLSFNGNKVMTTSGGGMILTDDSVLASRARYLATQARQTVAHYEHVDIGYNYRMSNLLAALGRAQLSRLDGMIERRHQIRDAYQLLFADVPGVEIFGGANDEEDNCWLTSIVVDPAITGWRTVELSAALEVANIESRPLWKPMHLQPVFADAESLINGNSQRLFEQGITLPSGSVLSDLEIGRIFNAIERFVSDQS
jgi:dTDP-4-amino-4,6-dideoxygalactose transaminase